MEPLEFGVGHWLLAAAALLLLVMILWSLLEMFPRSPYWRLQAWRHQQARARAERER